VTPPRRSSRGAGVLAAAVVLGAAVVLPAVAGQPRAAYTPAGNAAAKAVLLRLGDVPAGWKPDPSGGGGTGGITCRSFDPKQSDLTSVGRADSSFKSADDLSHVGSLTRMFESTAQAQSSWNRLVKPGLLRCLSTVFEQGGSSAKSTTTVLSAGKLPLRVAGRRHAAYRIAADVATGGRHVNVYLDLILQGGGPANAVMLVTSVLDPPSAALESRLATVVAGRLPR
jgi:hypothetical protein